MMKKFHNNAFAIRFKVGDKEDKDSLYDLLKLVAKQYPDMKIEGVNTSKHNTDSLQQIARIGNVILAKNKKDKRDLICIGVSKKFDISFENSKDLHIGGWYSPIPIYHIRNNAVDIVEDLNSYLKAQYPLTAQVSRRHAIRSTANAQHVIVVQAPKPEVKIVEHSTYVQVGRKAMSWTEYNRYKAALNNNERVVSLDAPGKVCFESLLYAS